MADHPPVPDPTSATTKAELLERLQALQVWAGQAPLPGTVVLGATGWLESRVVACLRARQWSADAIDRELGRWRAAVEAIERPTAEYPMVAHPPAATERPVPAPGSDAGREPGAARDLDATQEVQVRTGSAGLDDPTTVLPQVESPALAGPSPEPAVPVGAAATTAPQAPVPPGPAVQSVAPPPSVPPVSGPGSEPPPPPPWHRMGSRRVVALAGVVVLALIVTPAIVARVGGSSAPAASASPTGSPVESIAPAEEASPESAPRGQLDTEGMRPVAPSLTADPDDPAPSPPSEPDDEPSPDGPWSTIVDNTDSGRFRASGNWSTASDSGQHHGANFRYASPVEASDPAWYRVGVPETGRYRVDVWFPAAAGYNDRAPYIVVTTDGNQTVHVSQQSNGGRWVDLGTFEIAGGDAEVVAVSRWRTAGTGRIVADAIRVTEVR